MLFGPLVTRSNVGVVAPDLSKQLALGNPGQALTGPLQALSSHVDGIVELEVDDRDDGRVRDSLGEQALGVLHGVPALGVTAADEPADLNVDKTEDRAVPGRTGRPR